MKELVIRDKKIADRFDRFKLLMGKLSVNFMASTVDANTIAVYWEHLSYLDTQTLSFAVDSLIHSRTDPHFPTVAEILSVVNQKTHQTEYLPEPPIDPDYMKFQALMFGAIGHAVVERSSCPMFDTPEWWDLVREYARIGWRWGKDKRGRRVKVERKVDMGWLENKIAERGWTK